MWLLRITHTVTLLLRTLFSMPWIVMGPRICGSFFNAKFATRSCYLEIQLYNTCSKTKQSIMKKTLLSRALLASGFNQFTELELKMLKQGYKPEDLQTYRDVKEAYKRDLALQSIFHKLTAEHTVVYITTKGVGYKIHRPLQIQGLPMGTSLLQRIGGMFTLQTTSGLHVPAF